MIKTLAEQIREWMDRLEEAAPIRRNYDLVMKIENWEDPVDDNDPNWKPERTLGIDYTISGADRPARINYDDLDYPAEYADIDEIKVFDADTGQLLPDLPEEVNDDIEEAIWKQAKSMKDDYYDEPYDDRY